MSLVSIIITLIVVGVLLWLVNSYIPMDRKIKQILNIVIVIAVILWLLRAFGVWGASPSSRRGLIHEPTPQRPRGRPRPGAPGRGFLRPVTIDLIGRSRNFASF